MRRGGALALCLLALTGCARRSTSPPGLRQLAAGPPSIYTSIRVSVGPQSADVPAELQKSLAPLLITRRLGAPRNPAIFGLDRPQARLSYAPKDGPSFEVLVGSLNFDRHFLYAQRPQANVVFLVPADTLRPVLALAGLELPPPG